MIAVFECESDHRFALVDPEAWDPDLMVKCPVCEGPVHILDREIRVDPREMGGDMPGPGGSFDRGGVVVDTRNAILVDNTWFAHVDDWSHLNPDGVYAILVEGRINRTTDRAKVMIIGDIDYLGTLIANIHGVAARMGKSQELHEAAEREWREMPQP